METEPASIRITVRSPSYRVSADGLSRPTEYPACEVTRLVPIGMPLAPDYFDWLFSDMLRRLGELQSGPNDKYEWSAEPV